jgi:DNA-binding HxlR family transcriptional regulator
MEIDGAALKMTCDPRRHDDLFFGFRHASGTDDWPVFPAHLLLPFADGGDAMPIGTFVMDSRILGEISGASCCIGRIGAGDIAGNGRWKLVILFHLFGGKVLRFSDLERAIPQVSQKMLAQQLRQLEADKMVRRIVHPQVPPKVEYRMTDWGQSLCPALDSLLKWLASR